MLTPIAKAEMPMPGGRDRSALRVFANRTIREFLDGTEAAGEVMEVTGWPEGKAESLRSMLHDEAYSMSRTGEITGAEKASIVARRRGQRVFIERVRPFEPKNRAREG